jgi:hypothetical protein
LEPQATVDDALADYSAIPTREITINDSDIRSLEWRVTLWNKKGSNYRFSSVFNTNTGLRNDTISGLSSFV